VAEIDRQGGNFTSEDAGAPVDLLGSDGKPALSVSSDERFAERFETAPAEDEAPTAPKPASDTVAPQPAAPIAPPPLPPLPPPPADAPPEAKPARADFDDPYSYDDALVQWSARQATHQIINKRERDDYERRQGEHAVAQQKAINDRWMSRRQETMTKRADYADAEAALIEATNEFSGQQTVAMAASIMTTEDGPAIAYYLGKNPAEAKRIALIADPMLQLVEIGKISIKLTQPKPTGAASARSTSGRAAATAPRAGGREPSMEVYAERKRAERAAARRDHRL
jgi:hypothetical protein